MEVKFRSDCPFTSALDVLGDKWMLVIIKLMLIEDKFTFTDFIESDEAIATNILSAKLKLLESLGLVIKTKRPENKKMNVYLLTERGLALTPLLIELAAWSDQHLRAFHPGIVEGDGIELIRSDKHAFAHMVQESYRKKVAAMTLVEPTE